MTILDAPRSTGQVFKGKPPRSGNFARPAPHSMAAPNPAPAPVVEPRTAREAIEKALALLQTSGPVFFRQSDGCISCHHNSLPAIAVKRAIDKRVAVNTALATHSSKAAMATWRPVQENMAIGASSVPGMVANLGYELMALAEERFPRNFVTDAAALGLARLQRSDGSWTIADGRPPIAGSDIMWTALAVHGLQAYMPPGLQGAKEAAIRRARNYLLEAPARTTQDAAFLGAWAALDRRASLRGWEVSRWAARVAARGRRLGPASNDVERRLRHRTGTVCTGIGRRQAECSGVPPRYRPPSPHPIGRRIMVCPVPRAWLSTVSGNWVPAR